MKPTCLARLAVLPLFASTLPAADKNWAAYLGDSGGSHYSTLSAITTDNVKHLQKVWEYRANGAGAGNRSQIQFNPLIIDGVLYGSSPELDLFALNAASGFPKWRFTLPPGAGGAKPTE